MKGRQYGRDSTGNGAGPRPPLPNGYVAPIQMRFKRSEHSRRNLGSSGNRVVESGVRPQPPKSQHNNRQDGQDAQETDVAHPVHPAILSGFAVLGLGSGQNSGHHGSTVPIPPTRFRKDPEFQVI